MGQSTISLDELLKREWYLDTSLFADFLDSRAPVAFREAQPHNGSTIMQLSPGSRPGVYSPVLVRGLRLQVRMTKNLHWLHMIACVAKIRFVYSELVRAEAIRRLRRSHAEASRGELLDWWGLFSFFLKDYREVPLVFNDPGILSTLALAFPLSKNVQDYMHLVLAKERGALFITQDKLNNQMERLRGEFYAGIVYWPEAKQVLLAHQELKGLLSEGESK